VTDASFQSLLLARAERVRVAASAEVRDRLQAYFHLLVRWNLRINLTSLRLAPPTPEAIDRLLIEPLVAATWVETPSNWYDVGSGGGSPAIPFKIVHSRAKLTMVESRTRKAAFLREAVRTLELSDTDVECARMIEVTSAAPVKSSDLITMRGVKPDATTWVALQRLLSDSGRLLWFHSRSAALHVPAGLRRLTTRELGTGADAVLTIFTPAFHVEHPR
jgi:16S rRNA (guanine527-N7)-methyltransferase